jgi:hypothetical protein
VSEIFGLSRDDTALIANIARYHRRAAPNKSHLPYMALDSDARVVVNKLGAILRVANALDADHLQKVVTCGWRTGAGRWRSRRGRLAEAWRSPAVRPVHGSVRGDSLSVKPRRAPERVVRAALNTFRRHPVTHPQWI